MSDLPCKTSVSLNKHWCFPVLFSNDWTFPFFHLFICNVFILDVGKNIKVVYGLCHYFEENHLVLFRLNP